MKKRDQPNLFLTLDALVLLDHPYRKLDELLPFDKLSIVYQGLYSSKGRKEKGFEFAILALIIQFMEDLSDREMERYLQENPASKWFCDMNPGEEAPNHSYFGDFRKHLGTERLMAIFSQIRNSLQGMGLIREIFTFVANSGLINKVAATSAEVTDAHTVFSMFAPMVAQSMQTKDVNQRAKLSRVECKTALKSIHSEMINYRIFAGELWSDSDGYNCRNKKATFSQ